MIDDDGLRRSAVIFAVLAVCFVFDPWGRVTPIEPAHSKGKLYSSNETVRDPLLVARLEKIGFEYRCVECHRNFSLENSERKRVAEHTNITLNHGANSRCDNCHMTDKPEILVDYEGAQIGFDESEKLCGKCHGPMYRDWKVGVHGRPNGYWLASRGSSEKATCVQCHAPHSPAFEPMAPAPAPSERRGPGNDAAKKHATEGQGHG